MGFTVKQLESLQTGKWLTDPLGHGKGVFTVRKTNDGICFYFRYTMPNRKRDTLKFGTYDKNGANGGMTLAIAKEKVGELSRICHEHPHLRQFIEDQQQQEIERINQDRVQRETATLEALLNGYVEYLKLQGKQRTAQDVAGIFRRRVFSVIPDLAAMKASSITVQNVTKIVAAVVQDGKGREAAKLRSYMAAAFSAALKSESDPEIPPCLHGFSLIANPASSVAALSKYNRARDVVLNKREFQEFWALLQNTPGLTGTALRICILLGGQRPFQVLRLQVDNLDLEAKTITLYDIKGNRSEPRKHVLPLTDEAMAELKPLMVNHPFILSSTKGRVSLNSKSLSNEVNRICGKMKEEGLCNKKFQLRDVRRSIETLLAAAGISKDVRAQLQSHGLSGIQDRHYDHHDYLKEKELAIQTLYRILSGKASKIIPISIAAGR